MFKKLPRKEQAKLIAWLLGRVLPMKTIREWLAGKKTYFVAVGAIIGAIAAYASGEIEAFAAIEAIVAAVLAMTVRAGVSKVK